MSDFNISVEGGSSVRLPTAGKYVDRDIIITSTGGSGGGSDEVNLGTCTVVIDVPSKTNYYIARETVSSGAIVYNVSKSYTDANITVKTRCDSAMYVIAGTIKGVSVTSGEVLKLTSGQGVAFKTPNTDGESVTMTLSS